MKDGVIILNSARGSLIDEISLIKALESGKVASAWMDVYPKEPYAGKLTEYKQVLLTPHISTYTVQCRRDMEMAAVNNLLRDLGIDS
jgi:D-3-phosphoglycerate dehydrogenase